MKVAVAQFAPHTCDIEYNLNKMISMSQKASKEGNDLIVFPELALSGYNCGEDFFSVAQTIPGAIIDKFIKILKEYPIYVVFGLPEKSIEGVLYNSAVLIGPDGYIGKCRKNCLPGHACETRKDGAFPDRRYFKNGENLEVFDTPIGKIGILICYDIFFPENARLLALKNAEIIVGISGSPQFERDIFEPIVKVRAMENTINFAYANLVGVEGDTTYWGGSCIINAGDFEKKIPGTPLLAKASYDKEEYVSADIKSGNISKIRPFFPVFRDLTTNMFERLTEIHKKLS